MKFIIILLISLNFLSGATNEVLIKNAIVKIYTVAKIPNYHQPWNVSMRQISGSGSIIDGNRILTNAHVVANQTFIEVKRYGQTKKYQAKVLHISHQADLAILGVDNPDFFKSVTPLRFGKLPSVQQKVSAYGFPLGGNTLSVTTGIISRIEHRRYVHSGESFLAIQVDAAINPGNSGGPAISKGKIVGVVMQGRTGSQSIGYIVPSIMVEHFLKDIEDGNNGGFLDLGFLTQEMENPALRKKYHIEENSTTGQLVTYVLHNFLGDGKIRVGDILTKVDGKNIEDDGTVEFAKDQYTSYKCCIDRHQIGENIKFEILRNGEKSEVEIPLAYRANDFLLVDTLEYDMMPRYFIYGGYVFVPLTSNLLSETKRQLLSLRKFTRDWSTPQREEVVLVLKVLADAHNRGDHSISLWAIDKVNGEKVVSFNSFFKTVQNFKGEFLTLCDSDGYQVVIDTNASRKSHSELLKRYGIKYDRSEDLR